jgi:hypothetical protein
MLSLFDGNSSRRDFLTVGSLALGGLSLPSLLRAGEPTRSRIRKNSGVQSPDGRILTNSATPAPYQSRPWTRTLNS